MLEILKHVPVRSPPFLDERERSLSATFSPLDTCACAKDVVQYVCSFILHPHNIAASIIPEFYLASFISHVLYMIEDVYINMLK